MSYFNTLKRRLTSWFLSLSIIVLTSTIALSFFYFSKREQIAQFEHKVNNFHYKISEKIRFQQDIIYKHYKNKEFYESGKEIDSLNYYNELFVFLFSDISENNLINRLNLTYNFKYIRAELFKSELVFLNIHKLIKQRGHNDWGIIGKMRLHAHELENCNCISKENLLQLRRHEKDYILRNEHKDIVDLYKYANMLKAEIAANKMLKDVEKDKYIENIRSYKKYFAEVVSINNKLGNEDKGLLKRIYASISNVDQEIATLHKKLAKRKTQIFRRLKINFLLISILLVAFALLISFIVSNRISLPILKLSSVVDSFIQSNFAWNNSIIVTSKYAEVNQLSSNFEILRKELKSYIDEFQDKLDIRTTQIMLQKERIEHQNEEIRAQRDDIFKKNAFIEQQNILLEKKNRAYYDSINYSKRIQDNLLPSEKKTNKHLGEHFIFYKPKDIVSGDFYFVESAKHKSNSIVLLALADCTGHGVPGAFMSIIGHNLLRQAIKEKKVVKPSQVLEYANKQLQKTLRDSEYKNIIPDGMDASFIVWDKRANIIEYSGAKRPVYILRSNELIRLAPSRHSIGGYFSSKNTIFENETLKLESNDMIYLFSDGYVDQFGGSYRKKFSTKRFKELLTRISILELGRQKEIIEQEFKDWSKGEAQIDDVLVMGIRVP